ncbi:MAG: tRNA pseudouridine(55) synthase TruB [Gemmatimonadota bacterium]|nr:tRNA pseudouridine(55) synthase TruB [Gemmatimonadota bacterium]
MRRTTGTIDGLLLIDKPAGVSSHDVVGLARRALGEKRIGHAGTLDPFATGLLVLLVGRATRLLPHLPGDPKVYEATIRFGAETETEDLEGAVTREAPLPTRAALLGALPALTGSIGQVPPAYSAKRVEGRRSYELARAGKAVELPPVTIRVDRWEVLHLRDAAGAPLGADAGDRPVREARVRVTCGGGTYVRSLARDLARLAGSAAHLTALRRVRSGPFSADDARSVAELTAGGARVQPALAALPGFPVQELTRDEVTRIVRGIDVEARCAGEWAALTNPENGVLVALAERRDDRWQPRVVMHAAEGTPATSRRAADHEGAGHEA